MANFKDDKSSFQTDFIDKNGAEFPCVSKDEGAKDFQTATNNGNWGGPVYLIKPDKTFFKGTGNGDEKDLINAGIKPHQCVTPVIKNPVNTVKHNEVRVLQMNRNNLKVKVLNTGAYAFAIYSVDGQRLMVIPVVVYQVGLHTVNFADDALTGGIYIATITGCTGIHSQRVFCR